MESNVKIRENITPASDITPQLSLEGSQEGRTTQTLPKSGTPMYVGQPQPTKSKRLISLAKAVSQLRRGATQVQASGLRLRVWRKETGGQAMSKPLSLIFALGIIVAPSAQAMPVVALSQPQAGLTIQVGYGCGLGVHRGPLGACTPVYVYGGHDRYYRAYVRGYYRGYRRGYYAGRHRNDRYPYVSRLPGDVVYVDKGVCGFGSYLSCKNLTCWRFCY